MTMAALLVEDLHVRYAHGQVLNGVNMYAMPGEIVAIIGKKGSGRSSALRAISGQAKTMKGSVRVAGHKLNNGPNPDISHLGLDLTPIENSLSMHLTSEENLLQPIHNSSSLGGALALGTIYDLCPSLSQVRNTVCSELSHIQHRLLAIARLLRHGAQVILLNNIATGLSDQCLTLLAQFIVNLKNQNYSIILTEQGTRFSGLIADRFYLLEDGKISHTFTSAELQQHQGLLTNL